MQCLARSVARSARAAANACAGRRFVASGDGAAKSQAGRRIVAVPEDEEELQKQKLPVEASATRAKPDSMIAEKKASDDFWSFYRWFFCAGVGDHTCELFYKIISASDEKGRQGSSSS